jgi:hypothetical protein
MTFMGALLVLAVQFGVIYGAIRLALRDDRLAAAKGPAPAKSPTWAQAREAAKDAKD